MQEDKDGNDAADRLATAAADAHAAPGWLVQRAEWRKQMAFATQSMMLRILRARCHEERRLGILNAHLVEPDAA